MWWDTVITCVVLAIWIPVTIGFVFAMFEAADVFGQWLRRKVLGDRDGR